MSKKVTVLILTVLVFFCCTAASRAEDFLDTLAGRTWIYLSWASTNNLPWSWVSDSDTGDYCNPAEIGYYMLCKIGACEMDSITWPQAAAEIESTLHHLRAWQKGTYPTPNGANAHNDSLFYQWYWIDSLCVGPGSTDQVVPSIDNALLAASLITIREYADSKGADSIRDTCDSILGRMNFLACYDSAEHLFRLGGFRDPLGGDTCDYYSNENRIINFVARALGQFNHNEFEISLDSLLSCEGSYGGKRVRKTNWDGSYFTYTIPALFFREADTCYGDSTIDPATLAQIQYATDNSYLAWGISDAFWGPDCSGEEYWRLGAPPRCSPDPGNDPDSGIVAPHVGALAIITSYDSLAIANLETLACSFPGLYDDTRGFFDSVRLSDSTVSCRFSALGQEYILLSIMNYKQSLIWDYFHGNPGVDSTYAELVEWLGCGPQTAIEESEAEFRRNSIRVLQNPVIGDHVPLSLELRQSDNVVLQLYDVAGRGVQSFSLGNLSSGGHKVKLPTDDLSSGVYFLRLGEALNSQSLKLVIVR